MKKKYIEFIKKEKKKMILSKKNLMTIPKGVNKRNSA